MAWCDDLQLLHTNVRYLIHTVPKPNFFVVPQFGQTVFPGKRASFLTACSADTDAMVPEQSDCGREGKKFIVLSLLVIGDFFHSVVGMNRVGISDSGVL